MDLDVLLIINLAYLANRTRVHVCNSWIVIVHTVT